MICANNSGDKAVQSSKGRHKQQKISFSGKFPLKRMTPELDHLEAYGSFPSKDFFVIYAPPKLINCIHRVSGLFEEQRR